MAMDKNHVLLKFIIIGDSGTGKSCVLHRFTENHFSDEQAQTIGVEFGAKVVTVGTKKVKLQVWDTAGQERYRSVTRSYYRGASACILVYDVTRLDTFEHITQWLHDARQLTEQDTVMVLVGNKIDLEGKREVQYTDATVFAQSNSMAAVETSAATGEGVESAFVTAVKAVLAKQQSEGRENRDEIGQVGTTATLVDSSEKKCPCKS
jgi:small GTP-binding protein